MDAQVREAIATICFGHIKQTTAERRDSENDGRSTSSSSSFSFSPQTPLSLTFSDTQGIDWVRLQLRREDYRVSAEKGKARVLSYLSLFLFLRSKRIFSLPTSRPRP